MADLENAAVQARLSRYLADVLSGAASPIVIRKFATGQSNPTYKVTLPGQTLVLRRKPEGVLLKSAHAVDREFRVQSDLAESDVPVARMIHYCADSNVIGSEFYLMEYVEGRIFGEPALPGLAAEDRPAIMQEMCRVLAAIHSIDLNATRLTGFGPPGDYFERQLSRWTKQYRASETGTLPAMDALIAALDDRLPAHDGQRTLVHGDFRIDNLVFAAEAPTCRAVLDWELSTIGHPFADLAAVIMQWRMEPGHEGRGLAGIDRQTHSLPTDAEFVENYCALRGISAIENWGFYLAFSFFRMAAIIQGVKKRALDGNASNPEKALRLGEHVPKFAEYGLEALWGD